MTDSKMNELRADINEINVLLNQAKRKRVQDLLSLDVRKLETELINLKESEKSMEVDVTSTAGTSSKPEKRYQIKLDGYGWDQSDKYIKVFVTLKDVHNIPKDQVFCKLSERSMELHVQNLNNKDYLLVINRLLESINVEESHWKQKTDMIVIFLAKSRPNFKWSHVTEIEKKFEDKRLNKYKPMDMDKKDPQEQIFSLMQNMYDTGDDEMKRMISKAWYDGQQKKNTDIVDM